MKKTLILIFAIIIVLACAGRLALYFLENRIIGDLVAKATAKAAGSPLRLESNPALSIFPPELRFGPLSWKIPRDGEALDFHAQGAAATLEISQLLSGRLALNELKVEKPAVEINVQKFQDYLAGIDGQAMPDAARPAQDAFPPFELNRLVTRHGKITLNSGQRSLRLDQVNLLLENLRRRQETGVKCDFILSAVQNGQAGPLEAGAGGHEIAGNLAFQAKLRYYAPNLTFRGASLTFTATSNALCRELSPLRLAFDGGVNLRDWHFMAHMAKLACPQGEMEVKGEGSLAGPDFSGHASMEVNAAKLAGYASIKMTPARGGRLKIEPLILASPFDLKNGKLNLENLAIKIGNGSGSGRLEIVLPGRAGPLGLTGDFSLGKIALDDFTLLQAGAKSRELQTPEAGKTQAAWPELNIRLKVSALSHKKSRFSNLGFLLHGSGGKYRLDDFSLAWAGGSMTSSLEADLESSELELLARGANFNLGQILDELGATGFENGRTMFDVRLHSRGRNLKELKSALSGSGAIETGGLKMEALDSLARILQAISAKELSIPDALTELKARFHAHDGQVDFWPVTAGAKGISARARFAVDLKNDAVDGTASINALGMTLPVAFGGPLNDIKLGIAPDVLFNAWENTAEIPPENPARAD